MNKRENAIYNKNDETSRQRYIEIMSIWDTFKFTHMEYPFLRIGQLLLSFEKWHKQRYGTYIFFIEDDILELHLEEYLDYFKERN